LAADSSRTARSFPGRTKWGIRNSGTGTETGSGRVSVAVPETPDTPESGAGASYTGATDPRRIAVSPRGLPCAQP
jgi:hypothetical protein